MAALCIAHSSNRFHSLMSCSYRINKRTKSVDLRVQCALKQRQVSSVPMKVVERKLHNNKAETGKNQHRGSTTANRRITKQMHFAEQDFQVPTLEKTWRTASSISERDPIPGAWQHTARRPGSIFGWHLNPPPPPSSSSHFHAGRPASALPCADFCAIMLPQHSGTFCAR